MGELRIVIPFLGIRLWAALTDRIIRISALHIFGSSGKLLVELCVIGYLFGSCVTYYVVVGDLGPQILSSLADITVNDSIRYFLLISNSIALESRIEPLSLPERS